MAENIENFIGEYVKCDPYSFDGTWKEFLEIGVNGYPCMIYMDIQKPLKKMRIKKSGGDWNCICFQYEQLPNFCFYHGIIGHADTLCEIRFDAKSDKDVLKFDPFLRVTRKNSSSKPGNRWLRSGFTCKSNGERSTPTLKQVNESEKGKSNLAETSNVQKENQKPVDVHNKQLVRADGVRPVVLGAVKSCTFFL